MRSSLSILQLLFVLLFSVLASATNDVPQSFTIDGYLYEAGTTSPLLDSAAKIKIQILNPAKTCLLYEEQQTVDTATTGGYFNIQVGSALGNTKRTGSDVGLTMVQIFQNTAAVTAGNVSASSCTGSSYTPVAGDVRYFRVIITPSVSNTPDTLSPDATVGSAPNSLVAQSVQGYSANQFLILGAGDLSQVNLTSVFASGNAAKLVSLLAVPPTDYVTKDTTSGAVQIPTASGTPAGVTAGEIWYDSGTLKYFDGTNVDTVSSGSAGITSLIVGNGLTPAGTISSGGQTLAVDTGTTASKVVQLDANAKLPAVDGSQLTNITASTLSSTASINTTGTISSGMITANLTGNVTGASSLNVLKAGDAMTGNLTFAFGKGSVYTGSGTGTVTLEAPATVPTSYVLRLPATVASTGQLLSSDGSGNLSWITPSMTATSYSGTLPIVNGGTNSATALAGNHLMVSSSTAIVEGPALTSGQLLMGGSGGTPVGVSPAGDVTISNTGITTVGKLQGTSIIATTPTSSGQVLRYNGSAWAPNFVSMADLRSTITGAQSVPSCSANQTLTWGAGTDSLTCSPIVVSGSNFGLQSPNLVFSSPNSTSGTPSFRALIPADLPPLTSGFAGVLPPANGGTGVTTCPVGQALKWSGSAWACFLPPMTEDGGFNLSAGTSALASNTNATSYNIAIGDDSQQYMNPSASSGSNISLGFQSLRGSGTPTNNTGSYNVAIGYQSMTGETSGGANIALGYSALSANTTGSYNTALGYSALASNTTGLSNLALGNSAVMANTSGQQNIGLGSEALYNNSVGSNNIALGGNALYISSTGSQSIAIGSLAAQYQEATGTANNIAIGTAALQGNTSSWASNIGSNNVAVGPSALQNNTAGSGNVAIGSFAGGTTPNSSSGNTTGIDNIYIGYEAGPGNSGTPSNAIAIGAMAVANGVQALALGSNATAAANALAIGSNAVATANNSVAIGNGTTASAANTTILGSSTTPISVGINTSSPSYTLDVAGDIRTTTCIRTSSGISSGTCASDERLKTDIKPFNLGLNALQGINPKTYRYNGFGGQPVSEKSELGVIAQDVEKTAPELVSTKMVKMKPTDQKETEIKVVNYNGLLYIVINSVKDLYAQFTMQDRAIASVKAENEKLKQENAEIKARLERIEKTLNSK